MNDDARPDQTVLLEAAEGLKRILSATTVETDDDRVVAAGLEVAIATLAAASTAV